MEWLRNFSDLGVNMKSIRKSLLSIIIALAMVITSAAFPGVKLLQEETVHVSAAGAHTHTGALGGTGEHAGWEELTVNNGVLYHGGTRCGEENEDGCYYYVLPAGSYYLGGDLTLTDYSILVKAGTVNLCLNGHELMFKANRYMKSAIQIGSYIGDQWSADAVFCLYDESGNHGGIISNGTVSRGVLEYHKIGLNGEPSFNGAFTMNGGSISGFEGVGVELYVTGAGHASSFTMNGGIICNNGSYGVEVGGDFNFTMTGGIISGNYTGPSNDQVNVLNDGRFTMNGGTVVGGIRVIGSGTMTGEFAIINLNANNGSNTSITQYVAKNTDTALAENPFTYTGYSFDNWTTAADGSGNAYAAGADIRISSNTTLYAHWTPGPDGNPYAPLIPTDSDTAQQVADKKVTFNSRQWYIINDNSSSAMAGSLTLFAVNNFIKMAFDDDNNDGDGYSNDYSASTVKTYLDNVTSPNGAFANVADAINEINLTDVNVTGAKLYLLSYNEVFNLPVEVRKNRDSEWWLRSSTSDTWYGISVSMYGDGSIVFGVEESSGVRPALQLDLSKVIFSSDTKTFSLKRSIMLSGGANATVSGATTQDVADGSSISAVTYTANTGYHFEDFADITDNGIIVTKTSDTVVTVSGIQTGDVSITVPDAVENPSTNPSTNNVPSTPDSEPTPVPNPEIREKKNPDGSLTTKTTTKNDNGSVTAEEKTEAEDGSYTLVSETKDKDGNLISHTDETKTISKKGTAVVTTKTVNANGSTLETVVKTTKKGYTETSTATSQVTKKGNTLVTMNMTDSDGYELSMGFTVKKGIVTLTSFESSEGLISIPDEVTVNGVMIPVAAILKSTFKNNTAIINATVGRNVTVIGSKAFYGAKNLKNILVYSDVVKVGKGAFKGIAKNALIKIKADKENYNRIVELIKASGIGKNVKFKRIK